MNHIQDAIYKTIDTIVEQRLKEAGFDKTMKGVVVSATTSSYDVKIKGDIFSCRPLAGDTYSKGDVVYVLNPQQSPNTRVILGKTG